VNKAIIFNAACQPEFRASPDLLHAYCLGVAPQIDYIVRVLRVMGRHDNIALDSLTGSYRLIQQAIKAIPADISGFGAQRVTRTVKPQVQGPMEGSPRALASLDAGLGPRLLGGYGIYQRIAGCSGARHQIVGRCFARCLPDDLMHLAGQSEKRRSLAELQSVDLESPRTLGAITAPAPLALGFHVWMLQSSSMLTDRKFQRLNGVCQPSLRSSLGAHSQ